MKESESIKNAIKDGALSAKSKISMFGGRMEVHKYTITRNPYDRKNRKKEHVAWHNAFYEARKKGYYKRVM